MEPTTEPKLEPELEEDDGVDVGLGTAEGDSVPELVVVVGADWAGCRLTQWGVHPFVRGA